MKLHVVQLESSQGYWDIVGIYDDEAKAEAHVTDLRRANGDWPVIYETVELNKKCCV